MYDAPTPLGAWLRRERERRSWSRPEMARRLIEAAEGIGDYMTPGIGNITHNLYRWERGTVTPGDRYRLYFCEAFGIPLDQFGVLGNDADFTYLEFKGPVTVSITVRNDGAQISIPSHPDQAAGSADMRPPPLLLMAATERSDPARYQDARPGLPAWPADGGCGCPATLRLDCQLRSAAGVQEGQQGTTASSTGQRRAG